MPESRNGSSSVWKWICGILATALLALGARTIWLEIRPTPWLDERTEVKTAIKLNKSAIDSVKAWCEATTRKIDRVAEDTGSIKDRVARIEGKIDRQ